MKTHILLLLFFLALTPRAYSLAPSSLWEQVEIEEFEVPPMMSGGVGYKITDKQDPRFYIYGLHFSNGGLLIEIKTKEQDDQGRISRSSISGSSFLDLVLALINPDNITYVESVWTPKAPDNLNQFVKSIEQGMTLVQAAKSTWSGKMFSRNLGFEPYIQRIKRRNGEIHQVEVRYFKPSTPKSFIHQTSRLRHTYYKLRLNEISLKSVLFTWKSS